MTPIEEAQRLVATALTDCKRLGLPCLIVVAISEEGKVISTGGGLEDPARRALIAGAALGILHKATVKAVVAKPPRGFKLPKNLPATTPFPDQKPPTPQS